MGAPITRGLALERELALKIVRKLFLTRELDKKCSLLAKQNKGGTFHLSSEGHELIGVIGGIFFQDEKDWGFPYYRDRGFAVGKGADTKELLGAFLARGIKNHSGGRMMPEHYCDFKKRIPCQSSVVASQLLQAVGVAKGARIRQVNEMVYVSFGDGATSEGDFHEALNFSCLHRLPIVFVCQDNEWAISVPKEEQTCRPSIANLVEGYKPLEVLEIDGCSVIEVIEAYQKATSYTKEGPSLIVAKVPRIGPHSSSDDPKKYKKAEEFILDRKKDPLPRTLETFIEQGLVTEKECEAILEEVNLLVEEGIAYAENLPLPTSVQESDAFCPVTITPQINFLDEEVTMASAINHALSEAMQEDPRIIVFGQDVAHGKGGVFCITEGLTEKFGKERCFNTPLAEATIMGLALGTSLGGLLRPVAEIQFADYIWTGINQLFNEIASYYFRSNGVWNLPLVLRMPCGGYIQGGPYHSQSIEAFLAHAGGIKVVLPSNSADAKMLFKAALKDPNPVVFLEHKALYRQRAFSAQKEPTKDSIMPLGKAKIVKKGSSLTIVTWGMGVLFAVHAVEELGLSVEIIDLCTIVPLDIETVLASVEKTGKLLIVHEAPLFCGFGAEVAAQVSEKAFSYLDAPIKRVGGKLLPVPYAKSLENEVLPQKEDVKKAILELHRY